MGKQADRWTDGNNKQGSVCSKACSLRSKKVPLKAMRRHLPLQDCVAYYELAIALLGTLLALLLSLSVGC